MPSVPLRPERPSLYPDTSTVSYAFRDVYRHQGVADALRAVAREGNLLLSSVHLLEFARGGADMVRVGEALDELDVVWLKPSDQLEAHEVEHLLLQRERPREMRERPPIPTAGSFIGAFGPLPVKTASGMLRAASIASYLRAVFDDESIRQRVETMARESIAQSRRLFVDQKLIERDLEAGATAAEIDERLQGKARAFFAEEIRAAHARLLGNPRFVDAAGNLFVPPSVDTLIAEFPRLEDEPGLLPHSFVSMAVHRAAALSAGAKQGLRSSYFEKRGGDFFDWAHLVGAAYAEGFCCDATTAKHLGKTRARLGLSPPIVFTANDFEALAREIQGVLTAPMRDRRAWTSCDAGAGESARRG